MLNSLAPIEYSAGAVKQWQYYCATLAGLEIHERKTTNSAQIHQMVFESYGRHVRNVLMVDVGMFDPRITSALLLSESFSNNKSSAPPPLLSGEKIFHPHYSHL